MSAAQERIAEAFNGSFRHFLVRIAPRDVVPGSRGEIRLQGWRVAYRVLTGDAGEPVLEYYATHRMTDDTHVRIRGDGSIEHLEAIHPGYMYDPDEPGSKERAIERYLAHNRRVAEELAAAGLYPDGDVNAYLRTGGDAEE